MRNYILSALCMILVMLLQGEVNSPSFTLWWWVTMAIFSYAMRPFFNMGYEPIERYIARRRARKVGTSPYRLLEADRHTH